MSFINKPLGKFRALMGKLSAGAQKSIEMPFALKKMFLEQSILNSTKPGITDEEYVPGQRIIVSLTTYGKRIYDVALTIESLMNQTLPANDIILWLDYSFKDKELPAALRLQQARGLKIAYCKDIRSYKKLIPALQEYPHDTIITVDDDVIYEYDFLEHLIRAYQKDPRYIYAHRQHKMLLKDTETFMPYKAWVQNLCILSPDIMAFPTGCGGILYPPHAFDDDVFDEATFMDICPTADDVWYKAMALKNGTLSCGVFSHNYRGDFIVNPGVQDIGLFRVNTVGEHMNDRQLKAVFTRYDLFSKLAGTDK